MPNIAVDAVPLYALFDGLDNYHASALQFFRSANPTFVTNVAVLTEVAHLLSFSTAATIDALNWVAEAFQIDSQTDQGMGRIVEIMTKCADLPAAFADASLIAMCERRNISHIATFDKDFDVYVLESGMTLQNASQDGARA